MRKGQVCFVKKGQAFKACEFILQLMQVARTEKERCSFTEVYNNLITNEHIKLVNTCTDVVKNIQLGLTVRFKDIDAIIKWAIFVMNTDDFVACFLTYVKGNQYSLDEVLKDKDEE